jgi:hypothetical protein
VQDGLKTLNSNDSVENGDFVTGVTLTNGVVSISEGNLPNQFSNIKIGNTTITPDSKQDTLILEAGSNISINGDSDTDKITISATDTTYTAGSGLVLAGTDFNHSNSVTAKNNYDASSTTTSLSHSGTFTID